ncbi:MAG: helix-turn-helix transcriptional regulator [Desulfobacteraceae bacterium]|nr:helix-turn-helix transcriptional regulator [Desulfobacteraceae bacterium]
MDLKEENSSDTVKNIKKEFHKSLTAWLKEQPHGAISKLANATGITQGGISNIISGRRSGSEEWRRTVAEVIGISYTEMIGLKEEIEASPTHLLELQTRQEKNVLLTEQLKKTEETLRYAYKGWQNAETIIDLLKDQIRNLGGSLVEDSNSNINTNEETEINQPSTTKNNHILKKIGHQ